MESAVKVFGTWARQLLLMNKNKTIRNRKCNEIIFINKKLKCITQPAIEQARFYLSNVLFAAFKISKAFFCEDDSA